MAGQGQAATTWPCCSMHKDKYDGYVGEKERKARERISEHREYIYRNEKGFATGESFRQSGHSLANMKFTILEAVKKKDPLYRKKREIYPIRKLISFQKGMNRSPGGSQ